jgi:TolA-binding protein
MSAEIQVAPESTLTIDILTWFEENKKRLVAGFGIAIAAAAVIIVYRNYKAGVEESASKSLVMLLASEAAGTMPASDKLLQLAKDKAGTKAAERAQYLAAVKLFEDGKFAEAETQFNTVLNDYPRSALIAQASLGVAASLDAQNKVADALSAYTRFAAAFQGDSLVNQAKLAQGRIFESQGKHQDALAIYRELTKVNSQFAREAMARQAYLLQQHPELNPPAVPMTNSVKITAPPAAAAGLPLSK